MLELAVRSIEAVENNFAANCSVEELKDKLSQPLAVVSVTNQSR
jgi:hypothetical protein